MNVIVFKQLNGEEVISKIESETDTEYVLKSPRVLHVTDMGNGQAGAQFMPMILLGGASDTINVSKSSIAAWTFNVSSEYEKRYLETVSGIQLATSLKG